MDIKDLFLQLKTIEPRKEFTDSSRRLILASPQRDSRFGALKNMVIDTFRMGTAIALTATLILIIVNATFLWKILPTPQVAVLDPIGLRAEAQAIDIQIQLAQVNFGDLAARSSTISTAPIILLSPTTTITTIVSAPETGTATTPEGTGTATAQTPATPTSTDIDSALQELAK